jgi:hypothetical protein
MQIYETESGKRGQRERERKRGGGKKTNGKKRKVKEKLRISQGVISLMVNG